MASKKDGKSVSSPVKTDFKELELIINQAGDAALKRVLEQAKRRADMPESK